MKKTFLDYILKIRFPLLLFVILLSFVITFYIARPERDSIGYKPIQPIGFSHKLHAGDMQIDCEYCHIGVSKGRHALVPAVNICMNCHSLVRKDRPEIIKLMKYYEDNKIIPWKRVHKIPEYAYFNHSVHINKGIECITCHGDLTQMEVVEQVKGFTMTACLECHRDPKTFAPYINKLNNGPENCAACHR